MEWGYWSRLVQGGGRGGVSEERHDGEMTSPSRPATEHAEDEIVGELKSLSVMERSRRYGVVNSPTGLLAPIGKQRLPSPCSPDSALGSDDENGIKLIKRTSIVKISSNDDEDEEDEEEEVDDDDEDVVDDNEDGYNDVVHKDEEPQARTLRTPSVVISDHCDDPFMASSTLTLEEIERLRTEYESDPIRRTSSANNNYAGGDSGSDCSGTSSWSSWGLDPDYALRSQRKTSDCSTCSTLSGEDDDTLHPIILQQVVVKKPSGWRKLRNIVQWTPFFQTYKKQRYPWVQLAGHQGNFKAGPEPGTILKKLCPKEQLCFQILMKDILRPYVPEYKGHVTCDDGDGSSMYLQLQDLLGDFTNPCVMDCKIGVRTYLEEELAKAKEKPKLRKDMYEKMIQIDSNAPTEEEHRLKGVTKPRYMVWRETISSTATLGFRIEGIKKSDGKSSKDFKTTRTQIQIKEAFKDFAEGFPHAVPKYIQRLKAIKATLEVSTFFHSHEMIGSSLLFVHDQKNSNVWLIDFAKTLELPKKTKIDHASSWVVGNHEDGYLIGINNLINIFSEMNTEVQQMANINSTTLVVTAPSDGTIQPSTELATSATFDAQLNEQINNSHEVT